MNIETGCKAIDYVFYLSQGAKEINLVFTGGEPLLVTPLLRKIIRHAEDNAQIYGYHLNFYVKTNGSIVNTDVIELALEKRISFTVSVDGKHDVHDGRRVSRNGDVTHQQVVSNLKLLMDNGIECSCNVTVAPQCASDVIESIDYLVQIGVNNFTIGPAYGTVNWEQKQIIAFTDALQNLHHIYNSHGNKNDVFINPIHNSHIHTNDYFSDCWGCEALHSNIAILPSGQICGCSALAYLSYQYPFLVIGDVQDGIDRKAEERMFEIIDARIEPRIQCQDCLINNNCYGGCYAINLSSNGVPFLPPPIYCKSIKALNQLA